MFDYIAPKREWHHLYLGILNVCCCCDCYCTTTCYNHINWNSRVRQSILSSFSYGQKCLHHLLKIFKWKILKFLEVKAGERHWPCFYRPCINTEFLPSNITPDKRKEKKKSLSATDYIFKNGKAVGSQQLLTEQLLTLWNTEVLHYFRWLVYKFKQHAALFRIMRESQTQQGMRKQVR